MGGGDNFLESHIYPKLKHFQGLFQGGGAIVDTRDDMTMKIYSQGREIFEAFDLLFEN